MSRNGTKDGTTATLTMGGQTVDITHLLNDGQEFSPRQRDLMKKGNDLLAKLCEETLVNLGDLELSGLPVQGVHAKVGVLHKAVTTEPHEARGIPVGCAGVALIGLQLYYRKVSKLLWQSEKLGVDAPVLKSIRAQLHALDDLGNSIRGQEHFPGFGAGGDDEG